MVCLTMWRTLVASGEWCMGLRRCVDGGRSVPMGNRRLNVLTRSRVPQEQRPPSQDEDLLDVSLRQIGAYVCW